MTDNPLARLHRAFDLTPARADLLLCLYRADGGVVSHGDILDHISWDSYGVGLEMVKVQVCYLRKAIGGTSVANVWGNGYRLTPEGMEKVRAALGEQTVEVGHEP